jgi:hypothetical protein
MWPCHQLVLEAASSDTIQRTLGKSFSVSIVLSTIASWMFVMALGLLIVIEPLPPPSSIELMLFPPLNG